MKRKVLVIDDDVYCLDILVEYLSDKEFDVTSFLKPTCPIIEQDVATCPMQAPCYDIILSDNYMPGMMGLEFFELQQQRGCKIPAEHKALISGDISRKDQSLAEHLGFKVFRKPTSLDFIDSWIDEVLDKHSDQRGQE